MKIFQTISSRILFIRLLTWISTKNTPWSLHREPQPLNQSRLTGFRSAPSGTECARQIPVSSLNRIDHLTASSSSSPRVHERIQLNACFIYIYIYRIEIIHPIIGWGRNFWERSRNAVGNTVEGGKSARKRVEMRLLQWLPLPSIFVLGNAATISRGR